MKASLVCTNKRMYLESQILLESNQRFYQFFQAMSRVKTRTSVC